MNQTLALIFFFATAPVALMPSVIALATRHRSRFPIAGANVIMWGCIFLLVRSFSLDTSSVFRLPTYLALLAWLVLLGWSVRQRPAAPRSGDT
ncbi:hypothetical protein CO641_05750 [Lysobacteraceae bacterium NML91-0213]|nr:hypothetical protein CO641_05750 [Xanthomonadaceae bacterium NML91-0213]